MRDVRRASRSTTHPNTAAETSRQASTPSLRALECVGSSTKSTAAGIGESSHRSARTPSTLIPVVITSPTHIRASVLANTGTLTCFTALGKGLKHANSSLRTVARSGSPGDFMELAKLAWRPSTISSTDRLWQVKYRPLPATRLGD